MKALAGVCMNANWGWTLAFVKLGHFYKETPGHFIMIQFSLSFYSLAVSLCKLFISKGYN